MNKLPLILFASSHRFFRSYRLPFAVAKVDAKVAKALKQQAPSRTTHLSESCMARISNSRSAVERNAIMFEHAIATRHHPGEIDNRNADVAPSAALEASATGPGVRTRRSAYRDNGWEVEGAIRTRKT